MLWWFIGFWLASGAVLPAFLLLRMAYRWLAAPKIGPQGLRLLSGLVGTGIGALILWLVCSFSGTDTPSPSVVAGAPLTHAVVAAARPIQLLPAVTLSLSPAPFSPAQAGPPLLSEAGQVASVQPRIDDMGQSAGGDAIRQPEAAAPPTAPLHRKLAAERGAAHPYTHGPPVRAYITSSSSRGLWLFAPNGNEGANN